MSGGCVEADVAERCNAVLDGEVARVVSYGIAIVTADDGPALPVLHVRETFANRGDTPWTVELAENRVSYGDAYPALAPMLINSCYVGFPVLSEVD